jgi:hypothetical protein
MYPVGLGAYRVLTSTAMPISPFTASNFLLGTTEKFVSGSFGKKIGGSAIFAGRFTGRSFSLVPRLYYLQIVSSRNGVVFESGKE